MSLTTPAVPGDRLRPNSTIVAQLQNADRKNDQGTYGAR
jgi:hypothetical protein